MFPFAPLILSRGFLSLMDVLTDLSLDSNTIYCLDFGSPSCYPGSGQTVSDLSGNGNDFWLGGGSGSESSDPTFNSAGSLSYFSFDGGDYLTIKTLPSALQGLHKNNATFSVIWIWRPVGSSGVQTAFSTGDGGSHGVNVRINASELLELQVRQTASTALTETSSLSITGGSDAFCAIAVDEGGGAAASHWRLDSSTDTFDGAYTSPSTDNSATSRIGANASAAEQVQSGTRVYAMAVFDTDLTTTQSGNIFSSVQSRFGL